MDSGHAALAFRVGKRLAAFLLQMFADAVGLRLFDDEVLAETIA